MVALLSMCWAADLQSHEVAAADGHALTVWSRVSDTTPKRAVLLVHGRTWSARPDFDLQVEGKNRSLMARLSDLGHPTYAVDLRGYGSTERDASGFLTPEVAADDVAAVLAWVGSRHEGAPALLGWSRGSMVAQLSVQRHPRAAHSVVLYGYPTDPRKTWPTVDRPKRPEKRKTTVEAARSDFTRPDVITEDVAAAFGERAVHFDPIRVDWADEHQWNGLDPAKVTIPTLLLQGVHDPYVKKDASAALFVALGTDDRQWVVLPRGDHAAHLEDTVDAFVSALEAFWD